MKNLDFDRSVELYTYSEEDEKFEDYNPDDVPEDDTEDYEDHILRSHEEFDLDDTETESLNEEKEEEEFFYKWRKNLQDKYHISPLGDIGGTYYIHVAQRIDPSGHFCAGYREPTQEELNLCVKEAEALGQKAEIVDKDHIRIKEEHKPAREDLEDKNNNFDPEFINGEDKPLEIIGENKD